MPKGTFNEVRYLLGLCKSLPSVCLVAAVLPTSAMAVCLFTLYRGKSA